MASARNSDQEWDSRTLPTGWSRGYDEENHRCFYFRYDTRPPSISFTHPLDVGLDLSEPQVNPTPSSRSVSRPLPKPPGSAPYELAPSVFSKESPPPSYTNPVLPPPSPKPILSSPSPKPTPQPQHSATMRNPPTKMSVAQQLYASSFANRGPPGPSFSVPPPVIETLPNGPDQPSLYKHSVAAHVSPSPPALRSKSPTSTISSQSSVMSPRLVASPPSAYGSDPQSPPYSEFSLPDDDPRESSSGTRTGAHLNSTPHSRGRSESDGRFRSVMPPVQENLVRSTHAITHNVPNQTRSLFPLTYVDINGSKVPDVKSVSTTAKPPPGSKVVANVANRAGSFYSANPFPSQVSTGFDTPRPDAPFIVGPPIYGQTSPAHLITPSMQPAVASQYPGSIPPPPRLPRTQSAPVSPPPPPPPSFHQQQQILVAPVRPHSQPNSPLQPLSPPPPPPTAQQQQQAPAVPTHPSQISSQANYPRPQPLAGPSHPVASTPTSGTARPPNPPKSKTRPNGFMGNLANSLGKTAASFGTQALLSTFGIEEEEDDDGGGIADALVAGISNLTVGGGEGGGEPAPASAPGTMDFTAISDPGAYGQGVPPEAAPPPQFVSAVSTGGEYQTGYSTGPQYSSYSVELNYSSGGNGGNNPNHPNGSNSGNLWNPMANQQIVSSGNMYSSHTSIPNGAQQPPQPQQSVHPVYHPPQSANWNPYHYS